MTEEKSLETTGFVILFERLCTPEEKKRLNKNRVIDLVPAETFSKLPQDDNRILAGLPKEIPIKSGPISDIDELKTKTDDPWFNEMLRVIADTFHAKYTSKNNEEVIGPLIPVIYDAWKKQLLKYSFIEHKDDKPLRNEEPMWRVIIALADHFNRKKSLYLTEAFLKLYEEGPIKYNEANFHTKVGAAQLSKRGLANYVPEWPNNIRYERKEFRSFDEFNETIRKIIEKSIEEYKNLGQSTIVFEKAHEVLLAIAMGKDYVTQLYGQSQK
jgi:hypothetical protein